MSDTLPISVHVLTWNSGKTLRRALESVRDAEEILVIDGGSTDDTLAIAQEFHARVIPQRPAGDQGKDLIDFSSARNRGLKNTSKQWILSLDSDEYASPELIAEIQQTVTEKKPCACLLPRRYVLDDGTAGHDRRAGGTVIQYATTYPNVRLYFFHRDAVEEWIKPVHERPLLKPGTTVKRFKGASLAPLGSIAEYREKNSRYLQIEVEKSRGRGWKHWFIHRVLRTLCSRAVATVKLIWIWAIPRPGRRLPLKHELIRYWYAWKLVVATYPGRSRSAP